MSKSSVIAKPQKNIGVSQKYVVAIGASAGGLEAIHEFFDHMPNNSSFAFIVIQHLSSDYKSLLVELVSKHTHMKVFEAQQDMLIQSDCVYIIPNNKLMTFKNNRLKLADKVHDKSPNTAIDTFLLTLAREKKEKAIAVILSGTGTDGTKGIEAIKECGGLVLVQDPKTAKFDGMPNSAITSGNADFIMPPAELHKELYNYVNQEPVKVLNNGKIDDNLLDEIFGLIYRSTGNEFNLYKTPTIIRRIARRLTATGVNTLPEYVDYLKQHPGEVSTLGKEFLIGVTKFFRDTQAFDCLKKEIIPAIVDKKQDGETIKVWICACSTGEEAYSVAILLYDYIQQKKRKLEVKIFATDIDPSSIDIAAKNYYSAAAVKEVDKRLLDQYFIKEGKSYAIITPIRKLIVFARHDVIKAPPFIKNDLVTCRNMLIYMDTLLQQKVLSTFHFSLNPGGYLFLGSSETAGILKDGIQEINSKWKIYKKTGPINYSTHHTYTGARYQTDSQVEKLRTFLKPNDRSSRTIEDDFKDFVIDEFGYVGLYIDKNYEIKETIGNFRKYLSLPEKKLELNLLNMVPREASVILNTAIRKAWKENTKTTLRRIRIGHDGRDVFLNVSVKPPDLNSARAYTLILLHETSDIIIEKDANAQLSIPDAQQHEYIMELESELNETRNNLQMAVEEMDTTNEELQSSNEELLSANEELQSSNEELQSLNEELHTLNTEHQLKIKELIELNDDLDNYFKSTDIGQIFLDNNLLIRKFNPASVNMINLIEADIGRPISHISNNIKSENIMQDITTVMLTNQILEKEVQLKDNRRCLMRIMPYVRKDKQRDGVIVSFVDISVITELNNIINGVFNASVSAIMVFNAIRDTESGQLTDLKCITANKEAVRLFGRNKEELAGLHLYHDLSQLTDQQLYDRFVKVMDTGTAMQAEFCVNNKIWYHVIAARISGGIVVTYTDINERKQAEQKLRKNYNELITARENLKKLNEELESKVQERTRKLSESEERFSLVSKATNDTIWDWNLVNNIMWRSENFTSMFGYHRSEETESLSFWFTKVHPEDRDRVEKSVFDAINTGKKQWSAEYRFLKANNQYAIILDRGSILHDDFNTPYRMVGSIVDITRLIEAEKKMSSSENRFRRVYESNMIGMIFSDNNNVIVDANDAFLNMIGYSHADMRDSQLKWSDITPPEYMDVSNWAQEQLKLNGYCPAFEKQYIKKDGGRLSVLMGSATLEEDPTANTVTYIIDITEQKEAERRRKELQQLIKKQQDEFYSIFLNAPALISIRRGRELRYEFVNKAFEEFEGSNNYIGKTAEEAHADRLGSKFTAIEKQVLKTGKPYIGKAVQVELEDQITGGLHEGWFDVIFTPVFTSNGKVDGIAFFGFDVTDLVKAQQATRELMQKKDEFMSIASHELKTPITSLKGSLQIMQRMAANNGDIRNVHTFIDKAAKQTSRLTSLVDDLLDVTRIHAGKMMFNYSWFNAGESIKDCVEDVQANVTSHQIIIEGDANVDIYADRPRLDQVLSNFLSNAIKYSPEENKIIVTNRITENNMLYVSVKDFGIGIPGDKKDFVFDRFFRVQESSHKFSGLGLGLYISAEIIRRHHGEIGVESSEHEGSTFWFTIPITKKN
ncbi:chemotaxis protein CheB [Mucilaginibacter sp. KACC 22063]|uniref:chemotaxis protein CheB n=1 Tax=Mucilaginibacter sp. KACC 22063 TaxID=3025666 RepID=UPI0023654492|nr:chemotaxis protein CheB [Mucilaginibacter sp. KACC 22063]WDF55469.1 chemotaxis protein CheB [Mucilaginibacter sp. KACC 22063]